MQQHLYMIESLHRDYVFGHDRHLGIILDAINLLMMRCSPSTVVNEDSRCHLHAYDSKW